MSSGDGLCAGLYSSWSVTRENVATGINDGFEDFCLYEIRVCSEIDPVVCFDIWKSEAGVLDFSVMIKDDAIFSGISNDDEDFGGAEVFDGVEVCVDDEVFGEAEIFSNAEPFGDRAASGEHCLKPSC